MYEDILMNVNYFANFIFIENDKNKKFTFSSSEFEHSKHLFFFLLDLLFRGLVLLFGTQTIHSTQLQEVRSTSVNLNDLSLEQIELIKDKLKLGHIKLNFDYYHYSTVESGDISVITKYKISNVNELKIYDNNLNLKDYVFKISLNDYIYNINFELIPDY
jgi:hypothetical protein